MQNMQKLNMRGPRKGMIQQHNYIWVSNSSNHPLVIAHRSFTPLTETSVVIVQLSYNNRYILRNACLLFTYTYTFIRRVILIRSNVKFNLYAIIVHQLCYNRVFWGKTFNRSNFWWIWSNKMEQFIEHFEKWQFEE